VFDYLGEYLMDEAIKRLEKLKAEYEELLNDMGNSVEYYEKYRQRVAAIEAALDRLRD
jgi:predicted  nucleic acid-binding Zn-ribbon protein